MEEIWKDIVGYEGKYQVSSFGKVRALRYKRGKMKEMTLKDNGRGYQRVHLTNSNGKDRKVFVHRIVAMAFLGNVENLEINHIDGDKKNNKVDNLEICNRLENIRHSFRCLGRKSWAKGKSGLAAPRSKPVVALTLQNDVIAETDTVTGMAKRMRVSNKSILDVLKKRKPHHKNVVYIYGKKRPSFAKKRVNNLGWQRTYSSLK